jgi:hypothetical protein
MIQLQRVRTAKAIPAAFRGDKRRLREIELLKARRKSLQAGEKLDLESSLWKPAKEQLLRETGDKCGYCEASASTVCHCDVEHIRPKAIYWWLALDPTLLPLLEASPLPDPLPFPRGEGTCLAV